MSQLFTLTKQLTAAVANNIALSQTLVGAGAVTLNGSTVSGGVATLDTQRRIGITSAGNDSAVNFTIKGTDYAGAPRTEVLAGSNGGVAQSQFDYLTITSIAASAATTAITVGTTGVGSTPWFVPTAHLDPFEVAVGYELLSGTQNVTVETTDDPLLMPLPIYQSGWSQANPIPVAAAWPGMANLAANAKGLVNSVSHGIRMTVNSGTGKGKLNIRQAGLTS